ncbi:MAG TPA: hypothetical protein VKS21_00955, partial [Spirochaetota bacterium]|nr:hypothetical protein [Spirochaetota bacterium]
MQNSRKILGVLIVITGFSLYGFYYFNDFTNSLGSEWVINYEYAMEGYLVSGGNNSAITSGSGSLIVDGDPYHTCCEYNGTWSGNTVRLTNLYYATKKVPFGFDIYRSSARIDGDTFQNVNSATRSENQLDIWLVSGTPAPSSSYTSFPDFFLFFERGTRGNANEPYDFYANPINRSRLGVFSQSLFFLNLSNAVDHSGRRVNLDQTNSGYHSLNYKYNWEGDTGDSAGTGDFTGPNQSNANDYIFRIVHDGEYVSLYVNPDPDNNDNYPNEFLLLTNKRVFWSSNLSIMLGHEVKNNEMVTQRAVYDHLRIRSTAEASGFRLAPPLWYQDGYACQVELLITNITGRHDAGINTVIIKSAYNNLSFCQELQGVADSKLAAEINGRKSSFKVTEAAGQLKLIFPDLSRQDPVYRIRLPLKVKSPQHSFARSDSKRRVVGKLKVWVQGAHYEEYPATWGRSATCGPQQSAGRGLLFRTRDKGVVSC